MITMTGSEALFVTAVANSRRGTPIVSDQEYADIKAKLQKERSWVTSRAEDPLEQLGLSTFMSISTGPSLRQHTNKIERGDFLTHFSIFGWFYLFIYLKICHDHIRSPSPIVLSGRSLTLKKPATRHTRFLLITRQWRQRQR